MFVWTPMNTRRVPRSDFNHQSAPTHSAQLSTSHSLGHPVIHSPGSHSCAWFDAISLECVRSEEFLQVLCGRSQLCKHWYLLRSRFVSIQIRTRDRLISTIPLWQGLTGRVQVASTMYCNRPCLCWGRQGSTCTAQHQRTS